MNRSLPLLLCLAFSIVTTSVRAGDDDYGAIDSWLRFGQGEIGPANCQVSATINYGDVINHMDEIREAWLNRDHSADFYKQNALTVIYGVLAHKAGGVLTQAVYDKGRDKHPDKCRFGLSLLRTDDFGREQTIPILSWQMSLSIASKIVWDNFDDRNLPKIAMNWKFTPEVDKLLREESGAIPPPAPMTSPGGTVEDCSKTIKLHGYLSRAQFQCGFNSYSEIMMSAAKRCAPQIGDAATQTELRSGMTLFDQEERQRGHAAECRAVATQYSGFVRP
jgi:hypothetical protein